MHELTYILPGHPCRGYVHDWPVAGCVYAAAAAPASDTSSSSSSGTLRRLLQDLPNSLQAARDGAVHIASNLMQADDSDELGLLSVQKYHNRYAEHPYMTQVCVMGELCVLCACKPL